MLFENLIFLNNGKTDNSFAIDKIAAIEGKSRIRIVTLLGLSLGSLLGGTAVVEVYVAKHEYFHLLTQDLISEPQSKIVTIVNRSLSKGCEEISVNGRKNCHEFVADLLSAKSLTKKQKQLKQLILTQINQGDENAERM